MARRPSGLARPEDALAFLDDALLPRSRQWQVLLEGALLAYYFGLLNVHKFKARPRRGRPKGTTGPRLDDGPALAVMVEIRRTTGETRPNTLARLAIESGEVKLKGVSQDSVVRRLAGRYRRIHGKIIG
jgi:hypothetical protein